MNSLWKLTASFIVVLMLIVGCNVDIDAPQTPTLIVSPTQDETAVARLASRTPTATPTYTPTTVASITPYPTDTPTHAVTATVTGTDTPTASATYTLEPTVTFSATPTYTPSVTGTSTYTLTASATNTVAPTATFSATPTVIATNTPSPTSTAFLTDIPTFTLSATPRPTSTTSPTASQTPTATITPSQTMTATRPATFTPIVPPTATRINTPMPSLPPVVTATPVPSLTPGSVLLQAPTATLRASQTFTPFPSVTPNLTLTWIAMFSDPPQPLTTATPGGIYTLSPIPATSRPIGADASTAIAPVGNGDFYDPNATAGGEGQLPVAAVGSAGPTGSDIFPEQNTIVVSYAGQIVPLLALGDGAGSIPLAQGEIFAVSRTGRVAVVGADGLPYVDGTPMTISPSSQFGLDPNLSVGALAWSPDGHRLALRIDAANPHHVNAIDSGIWIYDPGANQSWHILRDTHEGPYQGEQLHMQRRARDAQWAPKGGALVIAVETPLGPASVLLSYAHQANDFVDTLPFAHATWVPDSAALIVSGFSYTHGEQTVLGRVELDGTYTEYLTQATSGLFMQYAAQLNDGRIAFVGGITLDSFALYTFTPGIAPVQQSLVIPGRIATAEWNLERTALLATVQSSDDPQLWIIRTDGNAQKIAFTPTIAHWQ